MSTPFRWMILPLVCCGLLFVGCTQEKSTSTGNKTPKEKATAQKRTHDEWWCAEHGIPEEECSMCSSKVTEECKKKNDWCEKHDRARSQCFLCEPALQEKYAARYRAKYGKEPPPIEE